MITDTSACHELHTEKTKSVPFKVMGMALLLFRLCCALAVLWTCKPFSIGFTKVQHQSGHFHGALSSWSYTKRCSSSALMSETGGTSLAGPLPGSPLVRKIDKENAIAYIDLTLTAAQTQKAFTDSCEMFNEEVKTRGYKVPGFRPGSKLPPAYLYQIFGEDRVKLMCGTLLSEQIQDECEKTGLQFVGRGRIMQFNEAAFSAGKPHSIEIECDLWPEINYGSDRGYKGLKCSAIKVIEDTSKFDAVKKNIMERYKVLTPSMGRAAEMGDVLTASMNGFECNPDGTKGLALPAIAAGDKVEIVMEKGKFMEGLVEGLVGVKPGETRLVKITFPIRPSGPGAALSGKLAIFEVSVSVVSTKSLPAWDATLANRVREGMSLSELDGEVRKALDGEAESSTEVARNDALAKSLLTITTMSRIPESLVEENTQSRFQTMLMEFKEQGSTDEQLQEMASPENYKRYREISRKNVDKIVTLGMVFRDIAEKEQISVSREEISEQLDAINAQAKQKGEPLPDARRASDEIENVILRRKIFNFLATDAEITWVDAPTEPQ